MINIDLKTVIQITFLIVFLNYSVSGYTRSSQDILVLGYDGNAWYPYLGSTDNSGWEKIAAIKDPAYLTWDKTKNLFFIKTNDGQLARYDLAAQTLTVLKIPENKSYTQLRASENGLLMVELIDGKSRDTQIVTMNDKGALNKEISQDSAQFHPYQYKQQLYYAHVSCRIECIPLIQEVWKKNKNTGKAHQITRLNATSYLHSVDTAGDYGYISSNQRGFYHLARLDLNSETVHWLSQGQVTDTFPSVSKQGDLYFIRRTPEGSHLLRLSAKEVMADVIPSESAFEMEPLPKDIKKIRYLELN